MNFQVSLISSEPQLGHVNTASPETPHFHKCISLFCSCYWFFAAEMSCSCFASSLKLWSAFPCAIIPVKKYSNHSHLVCYESAAFFVLYHLFLWLSTRGAWSSIPVCWDKLDSPFLASGPFPVLCFWSTSTEQPFEGASSYHRFKPFLAFPSASSYIFTCVHPNFSGGSNTGMLKVIFFFLIPPLCSACSSLLWQNKFLKDQSPIVNKDQGILVILHYLYVLRWWWEILCDFFFPHGEFWNMGDFQPTKTQHGEHNVPCLTFSSYFCPPHCDTHILFFAKQRTFCT